MVPRPALGSMPAADQRVGVGALILDIPCQSEDGNFDRLTVVRAPPNTSERPGGHVATVERPPTPRSLTRDCTTMGGGPSPQYAVAVRIVPSGYGKLASTRHRSAATRSSALMSSAPARAREATRQHRGAGRACHRDRPRRAEHPRECDLERNVAVPAIHVRRHVGGVGVPVIGGRNGDDLPSVVRAPAQRPEKRPGAEPTEQRVLTFGTRGGRRLRARVPVVGLHQDGVGDVRRIRKRGKRRCRADEHESRQHRSTDAHSTPIPAGPAPPIAKCCTERRASLAVGAQRVSRRPSSSRSGIGESAGSSGSTCAVNSMRLRPRCSDTGIF